MKSKFSRNLAVRLLAYLKPHTKLLLVGSFALLFGATTNLVIPALVRITLDDEHKLRILDRPELLVLAIVLVFLLQSIFFYFRHYSFQRVGYRIGAALRKELFASIIAKEPTFFDDHKTGDLTSRLSLDIDVIQRSLTMNVSVFLRYAVQVLGGLILMIAISPLLSGLLLVALPIFVVGSMVWGKKLKGISRQMQADLSSAVSAASEALSDTKTVALFAGRDYERGRYAGLVDQALATGEHRSKIAALFSSSMVFVLNTSIGLVIGYGICLTIRNQITVGELSAFVLYGMIVAVSFGFLINTIEEFYQAIGAGTRVFEIIDDKRDEYSGGELASTTGSSVRFDRVSFSYPSRAEVKVLDEISFEIPDGKIIAVVGPSGAGKTTIAALIPAFYRPQSGEVSFGGQNTAHLSLESLRGAIAYVPQNPQMFSLSFLENIRYGRLNATDDEVFAAAKSANIHDFILSLPNGYATNVGDRGVQLSGGEKQRLAIARALIKQPRFLILDEATSALDSENEELIRQAILSGRGKRTTLVIAHRLSTVRDVDEILVVNHGKVVEQGTHEALIAAGGLYNTLVKHQLL